MKINTTIIQNIANIIMAEAKNVGSDDLNATIYDIQYLIDLKLKEMKKEMLEGKADYFK